MMSNLNEELMHNITLSTEEPLVFREFVSNWSICQWDIAKWSSIFGSRKIPFRCMKKDYFSDEPCWERKCQINVMSFDDFLKSSKMSKEWMYFDYKYMHQWFNKEEELYKEISWKQFGHPEKCAADTTMWAGSAGSHTPTHQDTYGVNIVAQVYGKKRWILFPPETCGMKPTRVPYEESSIYSDLNFHCPIDLDNFNGLKEGRIVELKAGDALIVPRGWWHCVQNIDEYNIALNCWLPHEKDISTRVSEALIKIYVAQICKDLPESSKSLLLNPNEDDICDMPMTAHFLQLSTSAKICLDHRRKVRRAKRQKTKHADQETVSEAYNLEELLNNTANKLEVAKTVTADDIITLIKNNLKEFVNVEKVDDEVDSSPDISMTKVHIDGYSESRVIEQVKENFLASLLEYEY